MTTEDFLKNWAAENLGELSIKTQLQLKSPTLNLSVEGTDINDAVNKLTPLLKGICSETKEATEQKKQEVSTEKQTLEDIIHPKVEQTQKIPAVIDNVNDLLKGKQLLRIYDGKSILGAGEQLLTMNNMQYVVKEIK